MAYQMKRSIGCNGRLVDNHMSIETRPVGNQMRCEIQPVGCSSSSKEKKRKWSIG